MTNYSVLYLKRCFELLTSPKVQEIARQTGFIQRERQLTVTNFLPFLFRNHTKLVSESLSELCLDLRSHDVPMTKAGLNKRLDSSCVDFLRALFLELFQLQFQMEFAKMKISQQFPFLRLCILDGTSFKLPKSYEWMFKGTKDAGVKIQLEFDYLSGQFIWLSIEDGKAADTPTAFQRLDHLAEKDLYVQDLGYYHLDLFEEIQQRGAYFLSRARLDTQFFLEVENPPRHKDGTFIENKRYTRVCMIEEIQSMERGSYKEWPVMFIGRHKKMPARCVVYRHTEEQETQHKKRMKRTHYRRINNV